MQPWLTRIAPLLVLLVIVCKANPVQAGPPTAEQLCLELIDSEPGSDRAIEACERAHVETPSPRTDTALAVALAESGGAHDERVYELCVMADSGPDTDTEVLALMLRASAGNELFEHAWELHDRLAKRAGDDWRLHALLVEAALEQERGLVAARHMRKLRELDPPADELEPLEQRYHEEVPGWIRGLAVARVWTRLAALAWLVLTLITIGLGVGVAMVQRSAVAAWTPRSVDEPPRVPLRKLQLVLLRAAVPIYLSALLLLAFGLLLLGLAALGLAFALPGFLTATMLTIFGFDLAVIGLLVRAGLLGPAKSAGLRRDFGDEHELLLLSNAAASAMGVAPAMDLYFTTDVRLELLPIERRTLVIGIGLIDALDTDQFSALLCREYARTRTDGGAGHLVAPVLLRLEYELDRQKTKTWHIANPAWYTLYGCHRLYRFIASGAAREQDLLADRWAAAVHGSNRLADAIVNLADVQVRYAARLAAIEAELPRRSWVLANVYTHEPEPRPSEQTLAAELERRLATGDALTDGMSPSSRIARLEALVLPTPPELASSPARPLAQQIRCRARVHAWGTNEYRIALERKLNKFIKLEPELEASIRGW